MTTWIHMAHLLSHSYIEMDVHSMLQLYFVLSAVQFTDILQLWDTRSNKPLSLAWLQTFFNDFYSRVDKLDVRGKEREWSGCCSYICFSFQTLVVMCAVVCICVYVQGHSNENGYIELSSRLLYSQMFSGSLSMPPNQCPFQHTEYLGLIRSKCLILIF